MVLACAVYGGANYTNSWIGINALVILASLMAVSAVYSLSKLLPDNVRGKINSFVRSEMTQLFTSAIIIVALISVTFFACNTTASLSQSILSSSGQAAQSQLTPFQFAGYYIGTLTFQKGLPLLTTVYSQAMSYELYSLLSAQAGLYFNNFIVKVFGPTLSSVAGKGLGLNLPVTSKFAGKISISFPPELDIGLLFANLAEMLLGLFSPMLTLAISTLLIQYITLPFLQYTAFAVILPISLVMRSLAFTNGELRNAANALLAIAIAGYIIYPLTIAFDAYTMNYLFTTCTPAILAQHVACNPSATYLQSTYTLSDLNLNSFFAQGIPSSTSDASPYGTALGSFFNLLSSGVFSGLPIPLTGLGAIQSLINSIAEFIFQGVVLFALDIAITVGFAIGLSKALNAGLEGAQNFWAGL
ncbi:MAG TPA: hypothetical protein VMV00_01450 [Candidatus Baltobacteraceae bacterium]|nr:hypothetical protein [Candidatus Baltobacteraceae bacterium]